MPFGQSQNRRETYKKPPSTIPRIGKVKTTKQKPTNQTLEKNHE
jgi:hypothetical protein